MSRNHRPRTAPAKRTHWPERTASDCFDWFTPDDLVRHALAAYYVAARTLNKLPDDPNGEIGLFMNGREHFADALAEIFALRLQQQGFKAGAPGFDSEATHKLQQYPLRNDDWLAENPQKTAARFSPASISPDIHCALSMMGDTNQRLVTQSQFSLIN